MLRRRSFIFVLVFVVCLIPVSSGAQEPDFVVTLKSCKVIVAYATQEKDAVKVMDGDPGTYECNRDSDDVVCVLTKRGRGGAEEVKTVEFDVDTENPPLLFLNTGDYEYFMMINTTQRSAVTITRIVRQRMSASRVCQGRYKTSSDRE